MAAAVDFFASCDYCSTWQSCTWVMDYLSPGFKQACVPCRAQYGARLTVADVKLMAQYDDDATTHEQTG